MNKKKLGILVPVFIVPCINILLIFFTKNSFLIIISAIAGGLSLTAASSVCTINCFDLERYKKYNILQIIVISVSMICYAFCTTYEERGVEIIPIWLLFIISIIVIIIMCWLIILSDEEVENLKKEKDEINKLIKSSNSPSKKVNNTEYNIKGKEDKKWKN